MAIPELSGDGESAEIDAIFATATSYTASDSSQPNTMFIGTFGEVKGIVTQSLNYPEDDDHSLIETGKNGYLTLTSRLRVLNDDELPAGNTGGGGPTTTQIWRTG